VVEDRPTLSAAKNESSESSFSDISFMAIFAEVTENECIIERRLRNVNPLRDSLSICV